MKKSFLLIFFVLITSCQKEENTNDISVPDWKTKQFSINHDGLARTYILHKPDNFAENSPLVFVLHGFTSSATTIMTYSQMNQIADENGFMVCYPQGTALPSGETHWNANLEMSSIDDIGFLHQLANKLQESYKINPKNTFVSGMSNGGFMSYTLACKKSNVFKAIASITGTMSGNDWLTCNPSNKIPIMQISGTDDEVVPWDGTMSTAYGWGGAPHIIKVMDYWANLNGCDSVEKIDFADIDTTDNSTVSLTKQKGSQYNNEVWLYTVTGGGHDWPGSFGNKDISASKEIWKFFKQHLK
tara:strand:- start:199 stop:1098 length:900 start_codon:yes stop_codon:yes gene_type:complete